MATATLTSKGQTTIPREIREHLRLETGQRLEFVIDAAGQVILVPATVDVRSLKGFFPRPARPVSLDAMKAGIRRQGARKGRAR